jgi:hypothetical protein
MASPSSVITLGFGTPGSAALVVTLGFGSGVVQAIDAETLEWQCLPQQFHYTAEGYQLHYQTLPSRLHYESGEKS